MRGWWLDAKRTYNSYGYEQKITDHSYGYEHKFTDNYPFFSYFLSEFIRIYPIFIRISSFLSYFLSEFIRIYPIFIRISSFFSYFLSEFIRIYPIFIRISPFFSYFLSEFIRIYPIFIRISRFFFVYLHPESAARKKGGGVIIFMKVLKNDEALPSEIDSRAFFVVGTETRRLPILEKPPLSYVLTLYHLSPVQCGLFAANLANNTQLYRTSK